MGLIHKNWDYIPKWASFTSIGTIYPNGPHSQPKWASFTSIGTIPHSKGTIYPNGPHSQVLGLYTQMGLIHKYWDYIPKRASFTRAFTLHSQELGLDLQQGCPRGHTRRIASHMFITW
ncbi:hypothetical protein CEXT_245521 [Caerostris extrusa]|uniref:Uncharacterized protein n=1 Tax=Caerostris extrusa TaxID=172846 RepID=A0AAV4ME15_CAEEX|nr:hypothetical protein CEXT_245521 [Caerostris extrusa]